jgi:hypothetical protein
MSEQHLQRLRESLGLDGLKPRPEEVAVVRGLSLAATELPGLVTVRLDAKPDATPPSAHAFVRPIAEDNGEVVFRIDTYELPSAVEAHDHLARVLTEFQSPMLTLLERGDIGDVAVGHGDTAVVARRGNIVFVVRNAGRDVASVMDVARTIDRVVRDKAEPGGAS